MFARVIERKTIYQQLARITWIACGMVYAALFAWPAAASADEPSFPQPYDSQTTDLLPLRPAEEALGSIKVPEGFRAELFASEPMVQQPIAMAIDDRGRMWVAENYTYAEHQLNFDEELRDRIIILEDTDGDGRADTRKVFWDQAQKLTSVEIGFGGVWALCAPQLLFIPDADRDDQPDSDPIVVLDGWDDDAVRHNIVNGLRWGPDGWLYGRHGILATSLVGAPGTPPQQRMRINTGIWRFHPTRQIVEAVAYGTTNSWGMDWDDHGQMFFINTVIGHLWHVLPGAHYERMYGEDFLPHLYELMPQTADHVHWDTAEKWNEVRDGVSATTDAAGGGHAHSGLMIYLGDNWPDHLRGGVFTINLHGRRLNHDVLAPQGTAYTATHEEDFLFIGDEWFRGIDLMYGPDGSVYVADWSDIGECHENDGVHRSSGRIFNFSYGERQSREAFDLAQLEDLQLVELQLHKNDWYVRHARRLLQERAADRPLNAAARDALLRMFQEHDDVTRKLRAMWCLSATGAVDAPWLVGQLEHAEPHVRLWAVALLADGAPPTAPLTASPSQDAEAGLPTNIVDGLTQLAQKESSPAVLLRLASALQRIAPAQRWELAEALAVHEQLADDPYFARMLWYGIEPSTLTSPPRAAALALKTPLPMLRRSLARRLTYEAAAFPQAIDALLAGLADQPSQQHVLDVLSGMSIALRGVRKATAPASWEKVSERLARSSAPEVQELARELAIVFGDGQAAQQLLELVRNETADLAIRRNAIRSLVEARHQQLVPILQGLLTHRDLAVDAVRGLAAFSDDATPRLLAEKFNQLPVPAREEAIHTLVSRPPFARVLMDAVEKGQIPREVVSAFQIRQMRSFQEPQLDSRLDQLWPEFSEITRAKAARIEEVRSRLTPDVLLKADPSHGRAIFQRSCASCHTLFGTGGKVGPDLTGGQRSNMTYLLENIIDPSAQVAENFRMSILVLADGRVINGVIGERQQKTLAVQTATEKLVLPLEDIEEIRTSTLSMMPDQLLDALSEKEIRDLIVYLMSPTQVAE